MIDDSLEHERGVARPCVEVVWVGGAGAGDDYARLEYYKTSQCYWVAESSANTHLGSLRLGTTRTDVCKQPRFRDGRLGRDIGVGSARLRENAVDETESSDGELEETHLGRKPLGR